MESLKAQILSDKRTLEEDGCAGITVTELIHTYTKARTELGAVDVSFLSSVAYFNIGRFRMHERDFERAFKIFEV